MRRDELSFRSSDADFKRWDLFPLLRICTYNEEVNVFYFHPLLKRVIKIGLNGAKIMEL